LLGLARSEYRQTLRALGAAGLSAVIGGAWAVEHYVRLGRATRDVDVMVSPAELPRALAVLVERGGWVVGNDRVQTRVLVGDVEIDLVHHVAQGERAVGPEWLNHAQPGRLFGYATLVAAPEELVWSKLFVAARHRFDGADVVHLLRSRGKTFNWERLERHCAGEPELLLGFLTFFAFCYPSERDLVPAELWDRLSTVFLASADRDAPPLCRGPLLDRRSFTFDVQQKGFQGPRRAEAQSNGR
jgi:hypothetical protein